MSKLLSHSALCLGSALVVSALAGAASADVFVYSAALSGPAESPANASPGTGFTTVTWNSTLHTMRVEAFFIGLTGTTTAAHIHGATAASGTGTAGVATTTPSFTGFPLGVTSGTYDFTYDMTQATSYNPAYITANGGSPASAEAALFAALDAGRTYFNIHTSTFGGGEIRGFLTLVPTPGAGAMLGLGGLVALRRKRR